MKIILDKRILTIIAIIILAAISRFVSIAPNVSPIMAIALFGGVFLNDKRLAFIIPLSSMFISDIFLGFHPTIWAVYLGFTIAVIIGIKIKSNPKVMKVLSASLAGSIVFFIITNFAHWLLFNPISYAGFFQTYVDAMPFFRNSLIGDLGFTALLFGTYYLVNKVVFERKTSSITI